jgi:hypothetical protein
MKSARGRTSAQTGEHSAPELVPELFDTGAEGPASSGTFGVALLVGSILFLLELLAAPLVLGVTVVVSLVTWWLLDQPWSGHRRGRRRRGLTSRLLYLSTIMLVGLWLGTMFIFRASDPALSSGFTTTLPVMIWGIDISLIERLNGMAVVTQPTGALAVPLEGEGFAPFSLFVHGTAATVGVGLLGYAISSARRRLRRRMREQGWIPARGSRQDPPPKIG